MDLFVINRYKEDDEIIDNDRENRILEKLKHKIEERKKVNDIQNKRKSKDISLQYVNRSNDKLEAVIVSPQKEGNINIGTTEINDGLIKKSETDSMKETFQNTKQSSDFKILGVNEFDKKIKVKRVLPYWLANPSSISTNLQNLSCKVDNANWLNSTLKATLQSEGIVNFFPVQESVIPFILAEHRLPPPFWPSDICVSAPTGSGKTLAFVLPIVQVLLNEVGRHIRALIVLPVQELAAQVSRVFKKYCSKTGLKVALLCATTPLHQEQQQLVRYTESSSWVSEVDIIVCTAGRLVEHIKNTEGFSLQYLKFLVIDEADRIMDHIQNDWLYHLDRHMKFENELLTGRMSNLTWNNLESQKQPPHKLLFSATLSQDPEKLEQWGLFQPKLFSVTPKNCFENDEQLRIYRTPDELKEQFIVCEAEEKPLVLYYLLMEQKWNRVLCFTNASQSAHRLSVLMNIICEGSLKVAELSAALDRSTRESVLKKFHQSEINVLIGTDALARGIDVTNCDYVMSYDPPRNIKTYIHRVGRTGRAGRSGSAVTMLLPHQITSFKETLQSGRNNELSELKIPNDVSERHAERYQWAIQETKNIIIGEVNSKVTKSIALKRGIKH